MVILCSFMVSCTGNSRERFFSNTCLLSGNKKMTDSLVYLSTVYRPYVTTCTSVFGLSFDSQSHSSVARNGLIRHFLYELRSFVIFLARVRHLSPCWEFLMQLTPSCPICYVNSILPFSLSPKIFQLKLSILVKHSPWKTKSCSLAKKIHKYYPNWLFIIMLKNHFSLQPQRGQVKLSWVLYHFTNRPMNI
jgi:hypothetical protein